jgi:hypothetical protein
LLTSNNSCLDANGCDFFANGMVGHAPARQQAKLARGAKRQAAPIGGHALSVAMARFGKAFDLKGEDDAQELGAEHAKAAASWVQDGRLLTTVAPRGRTAPAFPGDVTACLNQARDDVTGRPFDQNWRE